MSQWVGYAIGAAILYGLHQVFTKLAAGRIGDGVGSLVVESVAALTILVYLAYVRLVQHGSQPVSAAGLVWSSVTGVCVGMGTILFFLLFQHGGPLSAVPMVVAGGAAIMAVAGMLVFREPVSVARVAGVGLAIVALFLMRK